ncbi:MAG: Maf family protein [Actinomycetota bacterium]|jgi:septum formation protein|nr:Maf family protein [Actinomycetota bacterium]MCL6093061.1 Maf family protein [Actinomycetota bacterium]MDA8167390.1 Maf family protein [Actinomycetota bacterium]
MYLASKSPRRKALLDSIGIDYEVVVPEYEEEDSGVELPAELVERHSRGKAWSVVSRLRPLPEGRPILGVDTMVVMGGRAVGKAGDAEEALAFLRLLSGRTHLVYSGVTLLWRGSGDPEAPLEEQTEHAVTEVHFAPIPGEELELYVASGEWRGKAGAYAIQERAAAFVESIRGDYTNIVGLPLPLLVRMLRQAGCWPPAGWLQPA